MTPAAGGSLLDALRIPQRGRIYDLSTGWWPGMPVSPDHPPFQLVTYRSPRGQRNQRDLAGLRDNDVNFGFISELVLCSMHSGTHIDALAHITAGPTSSWYGGEAADELLGDFGPLSKDASELPPLVCRGVMLDVAASLGRASLDAHYGVTGDDLARACEHADVSLESGDAVLVRTGTMRHWPDAAGLAEHDGAGLALDGARWLAERKPVAVGADTSALEAQPSGIRGDPQPVHRYLIQENGIPILEWVNQEELARDGVHEFLFVCLPLGIRGGTGSLVRPLAIS